MNNPENKLEIWSCNPADIPPWTDEMKAELRAVLAECFGWKDKPISPEQEEPSE